MAGSSRFPELDSLRGLAALAVFGWHAARELPFPTSGMADALRLLISFHGQGGRLGVIFFFLLSGCLITWRMLNDAQAGRMRLRSFYLRRALRTWPLHFTVLILAFLLIPFVAESAGQPVHNQMPWWEYALFLANFSMLWHGDPAIGALGVQWSVSIEEQFYLLWPLLLIAARRTSVFIALVALIVLASQWFTATVEARTAYFHLFGNLRYLGLGALLGAAMHLRGGAIGHAVARVPPHLRSLFIGCVPLGAFLLLRWASGDAHRAAVVDALLIGTFGLVLLERSYARDGVLRLDAWKPLPWLGERSYGLYLLHMPAIGLSRWLTGNSPHLAVAAVALALALSLLFAHAAHRFIENPFLRLKARLA